MDKRKKKELYVVVKGHRPGIYGQWFGPDGAAEQVTGFPKALYKGFYTRQEAIAWLEEIGATHLLNRLELEADLTRPASEKILEEHLAYLEAGKVVIYTDGAAIGNPGPGGFGVVLLYKNHRKELSGGFRLTTNNRMELMACIVALKALKFVCSVVLFSDSKYVIDGMTKGWAKRWKSQGWHKSKAQVPANVDLWVELLEACSQHKVEFRWVRGHAGYAENERCDQLATEAAAQLDLLSDIAYEQGNTTRPPISLIGMEQGSV